MLLCLLSLSLLAACDGNEGKVEIDFQKIIPGFPWFYKFAHVSNDGEVLLEYTSMEYVKRIAKMPEMANHFVCFDKFGNRTWQIDELNSKFGLSKADTLIEIAVLSKAVMLNDHYFVVIGERNREKGKYGFSKIKGISINRETGKIEESQTRNFDLAAGEIIFNYDSVWEKPIVKLSDGRFVTSYIEKASNKKFIGFFSPDFSSFQKSETLSLWNAPHSFLFKDKLCTYIPVIDYQPANKSFFYEYSGGSTFNVREHLFSYYFPLQRSNTELMVSYDGRPNVSRRTLSFGTSNLASLSEANFIHLAADNIALDYKRVGLGTANINFKLLEHSGEVYVVYTTFTNEIAILKYDANAKKMNTVFVLQASSPYELLDAEIIPDNGDFVIVANTTVNKLKPGLAFFKVKKERLQ